jgi:hypothetical protein
LKEPRGSFKTTPALLLFTEKRLLQKNSRAPMEEPESEPERSPAKEAVKKFRNIPYMHIQALSVPYYFKLELYHNSVAAI